MPRVNIFDNLVNDENSVTELLCNLMRFSAFRRALLAQLLSDECSSQITEDDIETQERLDDDCGQPDIVIRNADVCALIEVKVRDDRGCTLNQPGGYFDSLLKSKTSLRWLVFLLPKGWLYRKDLEAGLLDLAHRDAGIRTRIVLWDGVLDVIRENKLTEEPTLGPIFHEFAELLSGWLIPKPIVFSKEERCYFRRTLLQRFRTWSN